MTPDPNESAFRQPSPADAVEMENLSLELYKVIDEGGDPGPLTERLPALKRKYGLVEQPPGDPADY